MHLSNLGLASDFARNAASVSTMTRLIPKLRSKLHAFDTGNGFSTLGRHHKISRAGPAGKGCKKYRIPTMIERGGYQSDSFSRISDPGTIPDIKLDSEFGYNMTNNRRISDIRIVNSDIRFG